MIPKVIHYCWFGRKPLSAMALKCITSWKTYCPDYEIKEWNENNFNINCCDYVKEAYEAKKWAFVSDFARFWILYHEGGIYFDTDVELINSIEDLLSAGAYMGCEKIETSVLKEIVKKEQLDTSPLIVAVNPGLGIAAKPKMKLFKEILDSYEQRHFVKEDGTYDLTTVVTYTSKILYNYGWKPENRMQILDGITIYPKEYFCPMDYNTGVVTLTEKTRSIHHYVASWRSAQDKRYYQISQWLQRYLGRKVGRTLGRIIDFPHRVKKKIVQKGFWGTVKFSFMKIIRKCRDNKTYNMKNNEKCK